MRIGIVETLVGIHRDDGREDFLTTDLHIGLGIGEDGRREHRAIALTAGDEPCTRCQALP